MSARRIRAFKLLASYLLWLMFMLPLTACASWHHEGVAPANLPAWEQTHDDEWRMVGFEDQLGDAYEFPPDVPMALEADALAISPHDAEQIVVPTSQILEILVERKRMSVGAALGVVPILLVGGLLLWVGVTY